MFVFIPDSRTQHSTQYSTIIVLGIELSIVPTIILSTVLRRVPIVVLSIALSTVLSISTQGSAHLALAAYIYPGLVFRMDTWGKEQGLTGEGSGQSWWNGSDEPVCPTEELGPSAVDRKAED